jgi:uncharacterized membrane protein YdfJ with MMPL/SSD domain
VKNLYGALDAFVVRHRYLVVAVWLAGTIVAVATLPTLASQVNDNSAAFLPTSAPSNVAATLAEPLIGPVTHSSVPVVAVTDGRPLDAGDEAAIHTLLTNLRRVPTALSVEYLGTSPDHQAAQLLLVSSSTPFNPGEGNTLVNDMHTVLEHILLIVIVLGAGTDYGLFLVFRVRSSSTPARSPTRPWSPRCRGWSSISNSDVGKIVPIAILAIGLVLVLVQRSLVAPVYLILSVLLSYLASLGIAVIVFMKIPGESGIVFLLPFLMFVFLLALGEDCNILVMTRIREEARGHELDDAVVRAVGATGPTVTSAGLVLAASFVVLAVVGGSGPGNEEIRVIGISLAVGILLDTFVVRTVLVPSIVELLGRWNWWPSELSRLGSEPTA